MSNTTSAPANAGTTTSAPATGSSGRVANAYSTTFGMPSGIHLGQFDGSGWSTWSGTIEAILTLHEAEDVFTLITTPPGIDQSDWESVQRRTKAYLRLYVKPDVYSLIASDTDYPTFKQKWDKLKDTYGGASGSTTIFNLWIQLTQARLDDAQPMAPQLAKINEARVSLANASMGVTDTQFSLILLHALPTSYEVLASTILATGAPSSLKHSEIIARIINEEGRRSGPSDSSLNAARSAPIKSSGKKKDHSNLTCHYCNRKGHIKPDCRKKKKEDAEKKKKEEAGSSAGGNKAANAHIAVPSTATITEVDDNDIGVALYTAAKPRWMMDSGATHHITPHRSDFADYTPIKGTVRLGDKSQADQIGVGTVIFTSSDNKKISLSNVLHVPDVHTRFLSTSAICDKKAQILFDQSGFEIHLDQKCIAKGYREGKLYWLDGSTGSTATLNAHTGGATASLDIWHQRMGHMSYAALKKHGPSALKGMNLDLSNQAIPSVCAGCEAGKSTRKPFPGSAKKTDQILEIVHSDLAGPMQSKSLQGSLYIATFIDDHSRHVVIYYLKSKDQFTAALRKFLSWAETQTSKRLRILHSDRGGEYIAASVKEILNQRGIEHHLTMPGSPQQNGKAERFNRTILDKAMAILHTSGLSSGFWEYAISAAVHIYNRSPSRNLQWRTPHEIWNDGHVPDVSYLRIFGCKGYMHVPADKRRKLDAKATEVTFIGYEPGSKGYRLWDKHTRSVHLSRDVTFDESSFPALSGVEPRPVTSQIFVPAIAIPNLIAKPPARAPSPAQSLRSEEAVQDLLDRFSARPNTPPPREPDPPITPEQRRSTPTSPPPRPSATRIVNRSLSPDPQLPGGFNDRLQRAQLLREMNNVPRRSERVPVPNPRYFNSDNVAARHRGLGCAELLAAAYVGRDPATYAEAMRSDNNSEWTDACQYEIDALSKNNTWDLVDLPPGRKAVKSKWVFKLKSDGRYRARLVAKGFTQIPGIDYDETFSPVARFESIRLLLALAALEDWEIHQLDVKSAFLNGVLDEEIYMEQPQGFIIVGQETKVCRLKKAIYGLKQASRAWNKQFHGVLIGLGFTRTYSDAGIYVYHRREGDGPLFVILYVDDITILGASSEAVKRLKSDLAKRYEITDLGEIASYLGVRITRDRSRKRIEIDQSGYIKDIIDRFGMADANPHNTPLPAGAETHLIKYDGEASQSDIKDYQSLIGSLLYVQIGTRPDISFAVSRLAQYAANPSPQHLRLAKYVLSYLLGSVDTRVCYDGADGDGLQGYSDSSLGDQTDDRHSTSGYVYLLANGAISWTSRRQHTVAQSTTEAEYMAMTDAANQAAWYRNILSELGYSIDDPIPIHGDNKGAIDLALNPVTGRRSKHIDIKHHAIREYVENDQVSLIRTPTTEMIADGFTKSLSRALLHRFNQGMGLIDP
jgi:transposase InsO family protein